MTTIAPRNRKAPDATAAPEMPRPAIMGIINATPDSFSDGGAYSGSKAACAHGLRLVAEGADILDIGGESTRPGATPVTAQEEMARVLPIIESLRAKTDCPISIDTMKPGVARAAVAAGASIWNDVSALGHAHANAIAAELNVKIALTHMQGDPSSMQNAPHYTDVVGEVIAFLQERLETAVAAGVKRHNLLVDPGIGFGKTLAHNLALMRALPEIASKTGCPLLLGASRKSFIHALDQCAFSPADRLGGSIAAALHGFAHGAAIIRVHDVRETAQALTIARQLQLSS